jgi:hypothetical protein
MRERVAEIAYSAGCKAAHVMPFPFEDLPDAVRALWLAAAAALEDPGVFTPAQ